MREALQKISQDISKGIHRHLFNLRLLHAELNPSLDNLTNLIAAGSVRDLEKLEHPGGAYPVIWSGFMLDAHRTDNDRTDLSGRHIERILTNVGNGEEISAKLAWIIRAVWSSTGQDSGRRDLICKILAQGIRSPDDADRLTEYLLATAKHIEPDNLQKLVHIVQDYSHHLRNLNKTSPRDSMG